MILKFTHNMRISSDHNISVSSEQVVDTSEEAERAGEEFQYIVQAFLRGYSNAAS